VVFVKEPTTLAGIDTGRLTFKPIIVQCSNIDADTMLDELRKDIADGKSINELKLVYLPLFRGKNLDATGLFKESAKLIHEMKSELHIKQKVFALALLIAGKVVDQDVLDKIYDEVKIMGTGNVILDYAEGRGEQRGIERNKEETARKMLSDNVDVLDIIRYTDIGVEKLYEIRKSMYDEATA